MPDSTQAQEYISQAQALSSADKYDEALAYYAKAEAEDPMLPEIYFGQGECLVMLDHYDEAKAVFGKVQLIDPQNGETYFHLGNVAMLEGQFDEGKKLYGKATAAGFDNTQIYVNLASVYEEAGDLENAIRQYTLAIAKDPYFAPARIRKTELLILQDKKAEALQNAQTLMENHPDLFDGYHYSFLLLLEAGKTAEAGELIEHSISIFPEDKGFVFDKARYLSAIGKDDEALAILDDLIATEPALQAGVSREKIRILLSQEKLAESQIELERVLADEFDSELCFFLLNIYYQQNEFTKTLECCEKLAQADGQDTYYYSGLYYKALCLKELEKLPEAAEAFKTAVDEMRSECIANPGALDLFIMRALCYKELKQYDRALEMVQYVLDLAPDAGEAYLIRSEIYRETGEEEKAEADKRTAASKSKLLGDLMTGL